MTRLPLWLGYALGIALGWLIGCLVYGGLGFLLLGKIGLVGGFVAATVFAIFGSNILNPRALLATFDDL